MNRFLKAEVIANQSLHPLYRLLTLSPQNPIEEPQPGQFYMIGVTPDPLLKRPFSHFRKSENGDIQIFFRIKGKGTMILGELKEGSFVEIIGPLGRPYPFPPRGVPIIVAGGIGIASLYSLIEGLKDRAFVFYGARSSEELLFLDDIKGHTKALFLTTDDGSAGEKGLITERLGSFLESLRDPFTVYACGPSRMLERVSEITMKRNGIVYVSVEERMACGIGACLGCVIKTKKGYQRVCKEGPVFKADEIVW